MCAGVRQWVGELLSPWGYGGWGMSQWVSLWEGQAERQWRDLEGLTHEQLLLLKFKPLSGKMWSLDCQAEWGSSMIQQNVMFSVVSTPPPPSLLTFTLHLSLESDQWQCGLVCLILTPACPQCRRGRMRAGRAWLSAQSTVHQLGWCLHLSVPRRLPQGRHRVHRWEQLDTSPYHLCNWHKWPTINCACLLM